MVDIFDFLLLDLFEHLVDNFVGAFNNMRIYYDLFLDL